MQKLPSSSQTQSRCALLRRRPTKQAKETVDAARTEEDFWQKGKVLENHADLCDLHFEIVIVVKIAVVVWIF